MIGLLIYLRYSKANSVASTLVRSYEERNGSMGVFGLNNTEKRFTDEANKRWVRTKLRRIHFTRRERRAIKRLSKSYEFIIVHKNYAELPRAESTYLDNYTELYKANTKILTALEITTFKQGLEYYGCTSLTNFCKTSEKAL